MAVDQTEAMIAAIKAQLEKERAAEAAKKKREEEEELLKNGSKKKDAETAKSQHKTLSKEELERIEAKKRRKREEALGIVHEDEPETSTEDEKQDDVPKEGEGLKPEDKKEDKNQRELHLSSVLTLEASLMICRAVVSEAALAAD